MRAVMAKGARQQMRHQLQGELVQIVNSHSETLNHVLPTVKAVTEVIPVLEAERELAVAFRSMPLTARLRWLVGV